MASGADERFAESIFKKCETGFFEGSRKFKNLGLPAGEDEIWNLKSI
jgi:hypothetical protein